MKLALIVDSVLNQSWCSFSVVNHSVNVYCQWCLWLDTYGTFRIMPSFSHSISLLLRSNQLHRNENNNGSANYVNVMWRNHVLIFFVEFCFFFSTVRNCRILKLSCQTHIFSLSRSIPFFRLLCVSEWNRTLSFVNDNVINHPIESNFVHVLNASFLCPVTMNEGDGKKTHSKSLARMNKRTNKKK